MITMSPGVSGVSRVYNTRLCHHGRQAVVWCVDSVSRRQGLVCSSSVQPCAPHHHHHTEGSTRVTWSVRGSPGHSSGQPGRSRILHKEEPRTVQLVTSNKLVHIIGIFISSRQYRLRPYLWCPSSKHKHLKRSVYDEILSSPYRGELN